MVEFQIVKRTDIPAIRSVEKQGEAHGLGEFRDFRWHEALRAFMPAISEFSLSWALLPFEDVLEAHTHPIQSMMVIAAGSGEVFGDLCGPLKEGDVLVVPAGCSHGFRGGPEGMRVVTVQLGQGFYTDRKEPRIAFVDAEPSLKALLAFNATRVAEFNQSSIFELLADGALEQPGKKRRFLDLVNVWLDGTETLRASRRATSRNPDYAPDDAPQWSAARGRETRVHDSVLQAMVAWFDYQMFVLDDVEKAAIAELVVKRSVSAFCRRMSPLVTNAEGDGMLATDADPGEARRRRSGRAAAQRVDSNVRTTPGHRVRGVGHDGGDLVSN
jgi:mannose-6-phosphate isomerase-like protein (cupin superfamily)